MSHIADSNKLTTPMGASIIPDQAKIKEVMAKAQRMIEERKRQLNVRQMFYIQ